MWKLILSAADDSKWMSSTLCTVNAAVLGVGTKETTIIETDSSSCGADARWWFVDTGKKKKK